MDDTQKKEAGLKLVELAKKMGASDETLLLGVFHLDLVLSIVLWMNQSCLS